MADTSGNWFSNVLDAASFSCILVAIEECGRSLAKAGPTMPLEAQIGFGVVGIGLSFIGKKGHTLWRNLWGWVTSKRLREENARLSEELAALNNRIPTATVATGRPGVPSNAAELVWNWRRMVTNAHNAARKEKITFAEALVRDPFVYRFTSASTQVGNGRD